MDGDFPEKRDKTCITLQYGKEMTIQHNLELSRLEYGNRWHSIVIRLDDYPYFPCTPSDSILYPIY